MKFPFRSSHLALILPLAFLAAAGCGESPNDGDGSGGSSSDEDEGSGGSDGEDGTEDDGSGGSEDDGSGGSEDDGSGGSEDDGSGGSEEDSSGGTASGGQGSGGTAPTGDCGDHVVDPLEQCDGGNTCSVACTLEACDTCRDDNCQQGPDGDKYVPYLSCADTTLSPDLQTACLDVLTCVRESGCGTSDIGMSNECFCGDSPFDECLTSFVPGDSPGNGPCKDVINAATRLYAGIPPEAPANLPATFLVAQYWFDWDSPVGLVMKTLECEVEQCTTECDYELPIGTGGTSGSGGSSGSGGAGTGGGDMGGANGSGGAGTGGGNGSTSATCYACTTANCGPEASQAYAPGDGACSSTLQTCQAYQDCVYLSKCAAGSTDPEAEITACYCGDVSSAECFAATTPADPHVECQSAIESLTGVIDPSVIADVMINSSSPLGAINDLLLCQKAECADDCALYYGEP